MMMNKIPIASILYLSQSKTYRTEMMIMATALALTGFGGVATAFLTGEIFNWGIILFLAGLFFFQIRMNYLVINR